MKTDIIIIGGLVVAVLAVSIYAVHVLYRQAARPAPDGGQSMWVEGSHEKPSGVVRWLTTVDHKDIGLMYLVFGAVAFLWGGTDAMMMRAELFTAGSNVFTPGTYNSLFTAHGITMLFMFATPVIFGFANFLIPLLIGADDMAFPRINAIAFWLLPPALMLVRAGILTDVLGRIIAVLNQTLADFLFALSPPATGWTMYVPLSAELQNPTINLMLLGLHLSGVSTTMGSINIIVTLFTERSEEVGWPQLDIFSWTVLTQSALVLFAFPILGSALVMLLLDRNLGTTFFTVEGGGPLLWQHLFWFFGHPEVYIIVLPPMGLISLIVPRFAGRRLFGFKFIVYSTLAIGVLSFGVWAHHMFATGISPSIRASFMAVTLAIAIPSAVKVFNWITTMWNGRIRLEAPMLFCIGGISSFIIGGITGVFLASIPIDVALHDTYYVVGHFHLIIMGIIPFGMFAATYYWYPLVTHRMYNKRLAATHFWLSFVGVLITFNILLLLGYMGLPRRYATYPQQFVSLQQAATVGALLIAAGQLIWMWNMVQSYRRGERITDGDVWGLEEAGLLTREWEWLKYRLPERD